jgi:hypothetical protein
MALAKLILAHEAALAVGGADTAAAAGRVYDKIQAHLVPLLGSAGVRALLVRSVMKLRQGQFLFLEVAVVESSTKLREHLQAQATDVAAASAEALFGTFFALITTFIGERLTTQALRRAWPAIEQIAAGAITTETDK